VILEEHIYADQAQSGARRDRPAALLAAGQHRAFEIVLVDDLSRLARDNYLMLSVLAELHFAGVRVVSVADGLDSHDEEATLASRSEAFSTNCSFGISRRKHSGVRLGRSSEASRLVAHVRVHLRPCRSHARGQDGPTETRRL
jgi:DNA invertase Pin-like site-specific DNA recombinase